MQIIQKNTTLKFLQMMKNAAGILLLVVLFLTVTHAPSYAGGETGVSTGGNVEQFAVKSYAFEGEFLIIEYYVPFPGMTKVKLFQGGDLLWRNQYVNEKGDQKIALKAGKLNPGEGYTFQFSYKGVERTLTVAR